MKEVFIKTLKRAQAAQIAVAQRNDGYGLNVDFSSFLIDNEFLASFSVVVFFESDALGYFSFDERSDDADLRRHIEDLESYIKDL